MKKQRKSGARTRSHLEFENQGRDRARTARPVHRCVSEAARRELHRALDAIMESADFTNLKIQRSEVDAWERGGRRGHSANGRIALWLTSMAGVSLLAYGARFAARRSRSSRWSIASGATLLGYAAADLGKRYWPRPARSVQEPSTVDVVGVESMDSFPASDAPSSNASARD